jgi:hypothetical protein
MDESFSKALEIALLKLCKLTIVTGSSNTTQDDKWKVKARREARSCEDESVTVSSRTCIPTLIDAFYWNQA